MLNIPKGIYIQLELSPIVGIGGFCRVVLNYD